MNKITKASIAAAAGVVLLLGGGGTLAYWNGSANAATGTIQSGNLTVAAVGSPVVKDQNNATVDTNFRAVPGDMITITQNVTITSSGNNLKFEITVADGTLTGDQDLIDELTAHATYSLVSGANISLVSGSTYKVNSTGTATATVTATITWPFNSAENEGGTPGLDNDAKNMSVALGSAAFTVKQVQ